MRNADGTPSCRHVSPSRTNTTDRFSTVCSADDFTATGTDIGKTFVTHVALDSAADAAKAVRALKKL
jgi:hypothetical protein